MLNKGHAYPQLSQHEPNLMFKLGLTQRQSQVIELKCRGLKNVEIGQKLFIGDKCVKYHATAAYFKLGIGGRTSSVLKRHSLIDKVCKALGFNTKIGVMNGKNILLVDFVDELRPSNDGVRSR